MKLNVTIDISNYEDLDDIQNEIMDIAARQLIKEVMYNRHDHYGQTFKEDLEETVQKMLLDVMDTDFKEDVKLNVAKELSAKFERSKQAKEIKETFNISSDAAIKSGLQEIISNLVSVEINKRFKNL